MSDEYVTTRETLHGVAVHMHRVIYPHTPDQIEETAHVWFDSLPRTAAEVAVWFGNLPPEADVDNDYENPGSFDVCWRRQATPDEIAADAAKREADRIEAEQYAAYVAWRDAQKADRSDQ